MSLWMKYGCSEPPWADERKLFTNFDFDIFTSPILQKEIEAVLTLAATPSWTFSMDWPFNAVQSDYHNIQSNSVITNMLGTDQICLLLLGFVITLLDNIHLFVLTKFFIAMFHSIEKHNSTIVSVKNNQ